MHAAGAHREIDAPQRLDAGKGLHDASTVEEGRGRIGHGRGSASGRSTWQPDYLPVTCGSSANSAALSLVSIRVGMSIRATGVPPCSLVTIEFMPS